MTGYVLIAFLVIFTGIYFMAYNLNSGYPYFSYVLMNINYVLIIIIPMLTMRSFAEERKNKTDQLLLAAPVKLFDIVMGKYLAMVTVFAAIGAFGILLLTYLWSGILNFIPSAAWANAVAVAVLLTLVVLAVWNMTKNVVISGVLELIVLAGTLITYFVKKTVFESLLSTVLGKLELTEVFSNIADNHLLDVSGIILYLSLIVLFFFLTMQMIQKRRWS